MATVIVTANALRWVEPQLTEEQRSRLYRTITEQFGKVEIFADSLPNVGEAELEEILLQSFGVSNGKETTSENYAEIHSGLDGSQSPTRG